MTVLVSSDELQRESEMGLASDDSSTAVARSLSISALNLSSSRKIDAIFRA